VVARRADAPEQVQRDLAEAWTAAIEAAGLPLSWSEGARPRPRISFGAPLPVGMAADGELIDVVMTERWPAWRVREALTPHVPSGWRIAALHDVWLAGPPLAGRVAAADYRITLGHGPDPATIVRACVDLLDRQHIERQRTKGTGTVTYDLRPLVVDVGLHDPGPPVVITARTRFHPELGTGRPEEVVAALSDRAGIELSIQEMVRARLVLADDLG
jgi:radical SAM-linked protein